MTEPRRHRARWAAAMCTPFAAIALLCLAAYVESEPLWYLGLIAGVLSPGVVFLAERADEAHDERNKHPRRLRDTVATKCLLLAWMLATLLVSTVLARIFGSGEDTSPSAPLAIPTFPLEAELSGQLQCSDACTLWTGSEQVKVKMPAALVGAGVQRALDRHMKADGWTRANVLARPGESTYDKRVEHTSRLSGWRPRSAATLPVLPTLAPIKNVPTRVLGLRSYADTTQVVLKLAGSSEVQLTYPSRAVWATTPTSEAKDAAQGEQVRDVSLGHLAEGQALELDVVSPYARAAAASKLVGLTWLDLCWLIPLGLLALAVAPIKERISKGADARWTVLGVWMLRWWRTAPAPPPVTLPVQATPTPGPSPSEAPSSS